MLMFFAGLTALAVMASNQDDKTSIPDVQCLAVAQAIENELHPFIDKITGKRVDIKVVAGKPGLLIRVVEERGDFVALAEVNSEKEIVVFKNFCYAHPELKIAVMAHEMGHVIDFSINTTPVFLRTSLNIFTSWKSRSVEQAANGYGRELIKLQGSDEKMINLLGD